jgi:parvulin-like peptidyl-prolyl isomerase
LNSSQPYRLKRLYWYQILLIFLFQSILFAQSKQNADNVLARAGNTYIKEREFVERYEMLPGLYRHSKSRHDESKINLLYSIIAEKLLAQESKNNDYDRDTVYRSIMNDLTKIFARDELYRIEIANKTKITSDEIKKGIDRAVEEIQIEYLFFDRENEANFLRSRLSKANDFKNLLIDSSWNIYRDTVTIIWEDADPIIENEAYSLKSTEISRVIHSGNGYYILRIMNRRPNAFYTSMQPAVLREKVESIIRLRKEEIRLKTKIGYTTPRQFKLLVESLHAVLLMPQYRDRTALDNKMIQHVKEKSYSFINDTIAIAGKLSWSVNNIIDRLFTQGFRIDSGTTRHLASLFNKQLKVWVQQELLAQEAFSRGLDTTADVRQQIDLWSSYYLAEIMKARIKSSISVSDGEVWSYLKSIDSSTQIPQVQLRILRTTSMEQMNEAMNDFNSGSSLESVAERWSNDPVTKEQKGLTGFFPLNQKWPLGEIASQLTVGQHYGPLTLSDGIYFFEVVAKKSISSFQDTTIAARKRAAETELISMRQKYKINLFLAQAAKNNGFDIFHDRLKDVQVSQIPMMTYRILGFGGKMIAMPFAEPLFDWIDIEPRSTPIYP